MEYIDFEWCPSCPPCLFRPPPPPPPRSPGLLRFDLDPDPDLEGGAGAWGRFGIVVVMVFDGGDLEVVVEVAVVTTAESTDVTDEDIDEGAVEGDPPLAAS